MVWERVILWDKTATILTGSLAWDKYATVKTPFRGISVLFPAGFVEGTHRTLTGARSSLLYRTDMPPLSGNFVL